MGTSESFFLITVVSDDYDTLQEIVIDKDRFVIGKSETCDLRLKGWNVSKVHATFIVDEGSIFIEDSGSIFGTWVGEERITRLGPLAPNTMIKIGGYIITLLSRQGAAIEFSPSDQVHAVSNGFERSSSPAQRHGAVTLEQVAADVERGAARSEIARETHEAGSNEQARYQPVAEQSKPPAREKPAATERGVDSEFAKWRKTLHEAVLYEIDIRRIDANKMTESELRINVKTLIKELLATTFTVPATIDADLLTKQVLDEAVGLGPLEPMIADESVSEIMVNKYDEIWVERSGKLELSSATFTSDLAVLGAIERIVTPLGRRIDESSPMVDARLKDGSRVNAIINPLSLRGPTLTIRKFARKRIIAEDLIRFNSLTSDMLDILKKAVEMRLNIVVSGGTGTGKTTFLNMVGDFVPEDERIITIEDAAELQLSQPNLVSLESRPANVEGKGLVAIRDLVRNSLRMRPDRIIVGECRGGEALDMLQAMNTGHDGSMTTLHSNSPRDALARMEVLVMMAGMNLPVRAIREQIASAVHLIVQLTRFSCGARKVTAITEVIGIESETIQLQDVFVFRRNGLGQDGKTQGRFEYSGMLPAFLERQRHE